MSDISIRRVEENDLLPLLDIYNYYIRETPITFDVEPRTLVQRREWLASFDPTSRYQCFVAVEKERPIGWASSHRFKERAAYDTTVESSVYLAPDRTGQGIGKRLYATLFDALRTQHIHRIHGGITQPNPASNRLHESMGFERVGLLPQVGWKFGRFWDVASYVLPFGS